MLVLIAGLVIFLGVHLLPTFPARRQALVSALGELPYKGLFSLVALAGLILIVYGKSQVAFVSIWEPPAFLRHITMLLVLLSFIVLPAAYIPSNIKLKLKHPMLVAIKLWALGHLLSNGDLASMILFGSFLAFAIYDRISVKRRALLPTIQRQPLYMDAIVVIVGAALFMAVAMHHYQLFGVPVFAAR